MSAFAALVVEALRDAVRRRGLIAAAVASAGVALLMQHCGTCDAAVSVQGESLRLQGGDLAAIGAVVGFALIALWTYAITALLASDGLATALEDGTAEAVLARPVSREVFVSARLIGVWSGALVLGIALLALIAAHAGANLAKPLLPALHAGAAVATGALGVAALAMWVSLALPRAATLLLLAVLGLAVTGIEAAARLGGAASGAMGLVATWGPAWLAAPLDALAPWLGGGTASGPSGAATLRSLGWCALLSLALLARFRRLELPR